MPVNIEAPSARHKRGTSLAGLGLSCTRRAKAHGSLPPLLGVRIARVRQRCRAVQQQQRPPATQKGFKIGSIRLLAVHWVETQRRHPSCAAAV